ncbi:MAG: helix-turn-helix domain-containing protein, partial [Microcystaceae cyanobacterium]
MTTYRVKHNRANPYARLNKEFLSSPDLSAKAKGILAYLLSRPDDWRICINQLVKVFKDGEAAIRSGLKELKEAGYLTKAAVRDRSGRIVGWVTDVYEVPQTFRRQTDQNGNFNLHNLNIGSLNA